MFKFLAIALIACILAVAAAFAVLNSSMVTLDLYTRSFTLPLSILVLLSILLGTLLGLIMSIGAQFRKSAKLRDLRRQLKAAHKELARLRPVRAKSIQGSGPTQ